MPLGRLQVVLLAIAMASSLGGCIGDRNEEIVYGNGQNLAIAIDEGDERIEPDERVSILVRITNQLNGPVAINGSIDWPFLYEIDLTSPRGVQMTGTWKFLIETAGKPERTIWQPHETRNVTLLMDGFRFITYDEVVDDPFDDVGTYHLRIRGPLKGLTSSWLMLERVG